MGEEGKRPLPPSEKVMIMSEHVRKTLKRMLTAAAVPLSIFLITEVLSLCLFQAHLFVSKTDYNNFFRSVGITVLSGYALALNMVAGRMDLSLGAQRLIGGLIGGNLAISMGFGPFGTVLMCVLFGALAGLLSGLVFVILRLPTFVTGIGMALIYEALSSAYAPEGLMIFGNEKLTLLSSTSFIFGLSIAAAALTHLLLTYTTYGMQYNAIKGGLRVSINSGISVNTNILATFALCGALIGLSGILDAGYSSYMSPALNMLSVGNVFAGFPAVFLALFMQRICPLTLGIPLSVIGFKFLSMFLMKFTMPSQAATVITMLILLLLLVLMAVLGRRELNAEYRKKSREA